MEQKKKLAESVKLIRSDGLKMTKLNVLIKRMKQTKAACIQKNLILSKLEQPILKRSNERFLQKF